MAEGSDLKKNYVPFCYRCKKPLDGRLEVFQDEETGMFSFDLTSMDCDGTSKLFAIFHTELIKDDVIDMEVEDNFDTYVTDHLEAWQVLEANDGTIF